MPPLRVAGRVAAGRGWSSGELANLAGGLTALLGAPPVGGSLNIVLDRPVELDIAEAHFSSRPGRCFWPIRIDGVRCLAYRWRKCPLHIVECVSELHLRSTLGVAEGDRVHLELPAVFVAPYRRLAWAALWAGRRDWFYERGVYFRRATRFPVLGRWACQRVLPQSRELQHRAPGKSDSM